MQLEQLEQLVQPATLNGLTEDGQSDQLPSTSPCSCRRIRRTALLLSDSVQKNETRPRGWWALVGIPGTAGVLGRACSTVPRGMGISSEAKYLPGTPNARAPSTSLPTPFTSPGLLPAAFLFLSQHHDDDHRHLSGFISPQSHNQHISPIPE